MLVGGGAQVSVQSMLNVPSTDIEGSVKQAVELEKAGCQIIRAAIPNKDAVKLIPALKQALQFPLLPTYISIINWRLRLVPQVLTKSV